MGNEVFDMIERFGTSGPRYTSYPPAPVFTPEFGPSEYVNAIRENEGLTGDRDISLYFHIPFCDTLCYFCGCTTMITANRAHLERYLQYLKKEIDLLAPLLNPRKKVVQMHWGGGTPTYLSPAQIEDLCKHIAGAFRFDEHAERSIEIDPRGLTYAHLETLRRNSFNRISVGIQDFNATVQRAVNREQSEQITRQVIDWSRALGFTSINVDLIYGLPHQTVRSFTETLDKVIGISPDRIAVYNFAYVPWMKKHQKLVLFEDLPPAPAKVEILRTTIEKLSAAGYCYVGMDHFAKPADELAVAQKTRTLHRNFQGYSTKADADLYGLGMSAIGHFGTTYAQNAKTIAEYYQAIDSGSFATNVGYRMSFDDEVRKFVIMRLMCDLILYKTEVDKKFDISFDRYFAESLGMLEPLIDNGLVVSTTTHLKVTSLGRLFLRNIAMCFDAYLSKKPQERLYSQTV